MAGALTQLPSIPLILYTVVVVGFATTLVPDEALSVAAGDQVNVVPPEAVNVVLLPLQMVKEGAALMLMLGVGVMVMVMDEFVLQPVALTIPVTEYVTAAVGVAVTGVPLELLSVDEGLHV